MRTSGGRRDAHRSDTDCVYCRRAHLAWRHVHKQASQTSHWKLVLGRDCLKLTDQQKKQYTARIRARQMYTFGASSLRMAAFSVTASSESSVSFSCVSIALANAVVSCSNGVKVKRPSAQRLASECCANRSSTCLGRHTRDTARTALFVESGSKHGLDQSTCSLSFC